MSQNPKPQRRQQILEEIERLKRELASRQATDRRAPASVLQAYQTLLADHYERLDRTDAD